MQIITRPVVFVSSTIYDFRDLRSALRYWLNELGYEVLLSDYNDFPKELDDNSYQACLKAIAKADYFILLIGSRVGGWFNKDEGVSITRVEYREALKRFQSNGQPKIAAFVRQDLWDIKEDRAALTAYMKEEHGKLHELSSEAVDALAKHPSKFVNDAETVFSFLREVGQVDQMKAAVTGTADLPKANWIHRFSDFSDIASTLRVALGVTTHVERRVLQENLKQELLGNLTQLLSKAGKGSLLPVSQFGVSVHQKVKGSPEDTSDLTVRDLSRLVIFKMKAALIPQRLSRLFLEHAITSGMFVQYDASVHTYKATKAHGLLLELLSLVTSAQRSTYSPQELFAFAQKYKPSGRKPDMLVRVPNLEIAPTLGEARELARITDISVRLVQWLSGRENALDAVGSWMPGVFSDDDEKLSDETAQVDEAFSWVSNVK